MAIADDIQVAASGDVRYTGTTDNYTVLELHRFLQDKADDAVASGDDILDITYTTPSDRQTDNIIQLLPPYNIDDTLAQHLFDGSIIQASGDTVYDGIVNFGNVGVHIEVVQNGALISPNFWTTGLNADANQGISHRFLIKVRDGGADIDGRRLLGFTREFNKTYNEFPINGTGRGNNVLAIGNADDLNNQTLEATVGAIADITNVTEGYANLDISGDGADEFYYSEWDIGANPINSLYEYTKYLTRRGTAETIYGLSGDLFRGITHDITVDTPTGTWNAFEAVSWTGGAGQMLAINSPTAPTRMYIQLITGSAPTDGQTITGGTSGATADVNVTITSRTISQPFIGASTGSAIIGAYGIGIEPMDVTASDSFTDLDNVVNTPPNNVTFTVNGLVISEDQVLVGPESGGALDESQLTANGAQTSGAGTFTVNETIPSDTPTAGTIRIFNGSTFDRVSYTSFTGSVFTLTSTLPSNVANGANTFISYIDTTSAAASEDFTVVFAAPRTLFIRVRDGGVTPIKTFETTGTIGSAGGSATVIRTSDE